MDYQSGAAGRIGSEGSGTGSFMTFFDVRDRLVAAARLWRRMPDSDDRYGLSGRISSIWSQYVRDRALIDAHLTAERPRSLPPSRADIDRMLEATDWILHVPERDRRLVMVALDFLAGGRARVPWETVWSLSGGGKPGPTGIRMRFNAAITAVANALNG